MHCFSPKFLRAPQPRSLFAGSSPSSDVLFPRRVGADQTFHRGGEQRVECRLPILVRVMMLVGIRIQFAARTTRAARPAILVVGGR